VLEKQARTVQCRLSAATIALMQQQTSWPLVRKRTIPTDRPPLVHEILVPTVVDRGVSRGQRGGSPTVVNLSFLDRSSYFLSSSSSFILTRAEWTPIAVMQLFLFYISCEKSVACQFRDYACILEPLLFEYCRLQGYNAVFLL
jgi:hypothetical protein